MAKFFILISMLLVLGACGANLKVGGTKILGGDDNSNSSVKDSYEFSMNGCETKRHEFSGNEGDVHQAICAALQDDATNHFCAEDLREAHFKTKCPGMTWKPARKAAYTTETSEETL